MKNYSISHINSHLNRATFRFFSVLSVALFCLFFSSCSKDSAQSEEFPDWQNKNMQYWNTLYSDVTGRIAAGDQSWKIIKNWSLEDSLHSENNTYIIVHVLKEGAGSGCPLFTDSVRVHYSGRLLPSTSYPMGLEFDKSFTNGTDQRTNAPAQFLVSRLTDGFATALQYMHIGDNWEVYIPAELGYKGTTTGTIPAHSVLVFNITLASYYHAGSTVPDFKAKRGWFTE